MGVYEILQSYKSMEIVEISLHDLYERLNVAPALRKDFSLFKSRVLEMAQKEIDGSSISFTWEPLRKNPEKPRSKVLAIRFTIRSNVVEISTVSAAKDPHEEARLCFNRYYVFDSEQMQFLPKHGHCETYQTTQRYGTPVGCEEKCKICCRARDLMQGIWIDESKAEEL